jgi:hypothetical protein
MRKRLDDADVGITEAAASHDTCCRSGLIEQTLPMKNSGTSRHAPDGEQASQCRVHPYQYFPKHFRHTCQLAKPVAGFTRVVSSPLSRIFIFPVDDAKLTTPWPANRPNRTTAHAA